MILGALVLLALVPCSARAGGGPENTLVVVNSASWASVTVANHFIQLRRIPPINVVYIDWRGGFDGVNSETFRKQLLLPVLSAMEKRGLFSQIDCVAWSSDLPYYVGIAADVPPKVKLPPVATPSVSINTATYLWNLMMFRNIRVLDFYINSYMRAFVKAQGKFNRTPDPASHGFRSWYGWGPKGELIDAGGQSFMLSTMLAITSGRGNSVREAVNYLTASAKADGSFPKGTIFFTRTSDVRSTTRSDEFEAAVAELQKLGVKAEIITTPMPSNRSDVAGLISGVNQFFWPATRSTIVPGAICDNFTSFGGILTEGASQTPLTEFLRYGAAGAAGTVVEPMAIAEKFASPNLFVHYARGCTLAEAYYQSVFAPAQLLIVGDPLCQPWADIPQVQVQGIKPGEKVSGTLTLQVQASYQHGNKAGRYELFVDGRKVAGAAVGDPLVWDSTSDADGYHELSVVVIADGPIETQGRAILPVTVSNHGLSAQMAIKPADKVRWDEALTVAAKAPGMKQIHILSNGRVLGTIAGEQGTLRINTRQLGTGPTSVQAIGLSGSDVKERVIPPPARVVVEPAPAQPALTNAPARLVPGLVIRLADNQIVPVQATVDPNWFTTAGVRGGDAFTLQGFFEVRPTDVYQFQVWHTGELKLTVDGVLLYSSAQGDNSQQFVPVNLAAGTHRLTIAGRAGTDPKLRVLFGGPGALSLDGKSFKHPGS